MTTPADDYDPGLELADPTNWPFLPLNPIPMERLPVVGDWVWLIPERVKHSSFHQVTSVEAIDYDGEATILVVSACRTAWPLAHFAAAVQAGHPVLARSRDGSHAACTKCLDGGRTRRTIWMKLLEGSRMEIPRE